MPTELFHVWLKYHKISDRWYDQRLITFSNREAADEWWRSISVPSSVYAGQIKRISLQLYVQIQGEKDIWFSFYQDDSPETTHFRERMISSCRVTTHGQDKPVAIVLSPTCVTDHISGRWYFIRSKADPFGYWYLRTSGTCAVCSDANCDAIHASSDYRTRFCVRVRNNPDVSDDFVMIGTDAISIAAPKGYTLHIAGDDLKATKEYQGQVDFLFSDLKNRFVTRVERQVNGEVWEYVESAEKGVGEPWELVCG